MKPSNSTTPMLDADPVRQSVVSTETRPAALARGSDERGVDFDLHGLVGIRLLDATPQDVAMIQRQLGPIQGKLARVPDIEIRFVDTLPASSRVRLLGADDAGFTDDAFLVLRSKHKSQARVQIPFDRIGRRCHIVCQRGLPAVPLMLAIVNLTALARGALPLHASACRYQEQGILATGWAKGGKTESLLACALHGAEYVGDEWIYLSDGGRRMHGIPEPIRLWHWHLAGLPEFRARVKLRDRFRMSSLNACCTVLERGSALPGIRRLLPRKTIRRVLPLVQRQMNVQVPPERLFAGPPCQLSASPDKVFFVASYESPEVTVSPIDPLEVAERMVFSLQDERAEFMAYYHRFRFAFPEKANPLIDNVEEIERTRLREFLTGKTMYSLYHPYPVSIPALFDAMAPYL